MNETLALGARDQPITWGRMTMCEAMGASHAFLEEPGGLRLLLRGQCLADLAVEGGRALGTRLFGKTQLGPSGPWIDVEIRTDSQEAVLAAWLNRLLELAERNRWASVECEVLASSNNGLRARVRGVSLGEELHLGKAVIRSSSFIAPRGRGLQAEVLLEVPRDASPHRTSRRKVSAGVKSCA